MPVKQIFNLAWAVLLGIAITHPLDFTLALRKIEWSILRETTNTRSWGNPSLYNQTYRSAHRRSKLEGRP